MRQTGSRRLNEHGYEQCGVRGEGVGISYTLFQLQCGPDLPSQITKSSQATNYDSSLRSASPCIDADQLCEVQLC